MYAVINVLINTGDIPVDGWRLILVGVVELIPLYTLVPRFILSLRRLYERDLQGGRGSNIDTAFGVTSMSGHGGASSTIMFADGGQNEGLEQGDEIQLEEREPRSDGSSGW